MGDCCHYLRESIDDRLDIGAPYGGRGDARLIQRGASIQRLAIQETTRHCVVDFKQEKETDIKRIAKYSGSELGSWLA